MRKGIIDSLEDWIANGTSFHSIVNVLNIRKESGNEYYLFLKPKFVLFNLIPHVSDIYITIDENNEAIIKSYHNFILIAFAVFSFSLILLKLFFDSGELTLLGLISIIIIVVIKVLGYYSLKKFVSNLVSSTYHDYP